MGLYPGILWTALTVTILIFVSKLGYSLIFGTSRKKKVDRSKAWNLFERYDFLFFAYGIPSVALMIAGIHDDYSDLFWIGLGIGIYGGIFSLQQKESRKKKKSDFPRLSKLL